jgi:hypothetical protein
MYLDFLYILNGGALITSPIFVCPQRPCKGNLSNYLVYEFQCLVEGIDSVADLVHKINSKPSVYL